MASFSTTSWKWPDIHGQIYTTDCGPNSHGWAVCCTGSWVVFSLPLSSGSWAFTRLRGCYLLNLAILQVWKPLGGSPAFFLGYYSLWQSLYNSSLSLTFQYVTNPPSANERTFTGLADYIRISMLVLPFGYWIDQAPIWRQLLHGHSISSTSHQCMALIIPSLYSVPLSVPGSFPKSLRYIPKSTCIPSPCLCYGWGGERRRRQQL